MGVESRRMTPDEGYDRAGEHIPGAQIIMGPEEAREERIPALDISRCRSWCPALPGDWTWRNRDTRILCGGVLPHSLALVAGYFVEDVTTSLLTQADWVLLTNATAEQRRQFVKECCESADKILREAAAAA